jgi:23S rRNA pseudouridine1911/1915/1917 synthase
MAYNAVVSDQTWVLSNAEEGTRLDKWLAGHERLGSRSRALAALERGKIFVNDSEATPSDGGRRLVRGDRIRFWIDRPGTSRRRHFSAPKLPEIDVIFEDSALIVVSKPAGMLTVPLRNRRDALSLFDHLLEHMRSQGKRQLFAVHRIDRDTSGLVAFAKSLEAQLHLKAQFERQEPVRTYWAVVYGRPVPSSGTWRDFLFWDRSELRQRESRKGSINSKEAISHYRLLESFRTTSLLEVNLQTGKRNQIRVQAGLRGYPLVGEKKYLYGKLMGRSIPFDRQALHARRLDLLHPDDDRQMSFEVEPPEDFVTLISSLRK